MALYFGAALSDSSGVMNGQMHYISEAQSAKWNVTHYTDGWQKVFAPSLPLLAHRGVRLFSDLEAAARLDHAEHSQLQGSLFCCITARAFTQRASNREHSFTHCHLNRFTHRHTHFCVCVSDKERDKTLHGGFVQRSNIFCLYFIQCLRSHTANPVAMATGSLVEQAACCHRDIPVFPRRWGTGRVCMCLCVSVCISVQRFLMCVCV